MNTQFKHAAATALAGLMLIAVMPFTGNTAEAATKKMVVIGDSISFGKGLADSSKSFVSLAGSYYGLEVVNLAKDVCTTADLATTLDDPSVKAQLAQADVIVFTAGMQDVMTPFMEEAENFKQMTGADFKTLKEMFDMSSNDLTYVPTESELKRELVKLTVALRSNMETGSENILKIGEKLSAYPNAKVVCANVYNPLSLIEGYDAMNGNKKLGYDTIKNAAEEATKDNLDAAYAQLASKNGITVIDAYTKFNTLAYKYTGLNSMNYEPNELGHQWYGEQLTDALKDVLQKAPQTTSTSATTTTKATTTTTTTTKATTTTTKATTTTTAATTTTTTAATTTTTAPVKKHALGDVSGDGVINAKDANYVLVAAAKIGTKQDSGLSKEAYEAADVNGDKSINAKDANSILRYAAAVGTGQNPKITDFV